MGEVGGEGGGGWVRGGGVFVVVIVRVIAEGGDVGGPVGGRVGGNRFAEADDGERVGLKVGKDCLRGCGCHC